MDDVYTSRSMVSNTFRQTASFCREWSLIGGELHGACWFK